MAYDQEQRAALRILEGIEEGTMSASDSLELIDEADPALVYLLISWLRARYAEHGNADAVLGRVLEISKRGQVAAKMKEGKADPVVTWFEETHAYRQLTASQLVEIVVDKLES
jgi:hypothetical protein